MLNAMSSDRSTYSEQVDVFNNLPFNTSVHFHGIE